MAIMDYGHVLNLFELLTKKRSLKSSLLQLFVISKKRLITPSCSQYSISFGTLARNRVAAFFLIAPLLSLGTQWERLAGIRPSQVDLHMSWKGKTGPFPTVHNHAFLELRH